MGNRALGPVLLAVVLSVAAPACSLFEGQSDGGAVPDPSVATQPSEPGKVVVRGTAFNPERVTAAIGQEVVWTFNDGGLSHSVTADDGSFDSSQLATGEFRRAFEAAGEYPYHCTVHARMKAKVVVS